MNFDNQMQALKRKNILKYFSIWKKWYLGQYHDCELIVT